MKKKILVLLDTNIFYAPMYFKIDFIKELLYKLGGYDVKLMIPSSVYIEINNLKDEFPKTYFKKYMNKIQILNTSIKNTDKSILSLANDLKNKGYMVIVCTADNRLRKILKDKKIPCITVNKDKRLVLK